MFFGDVKGKVSYKDKFLDCDKTSAYSFFLIIIVFLISLVCTTENKFCTHPTLKTS